MDFITREHGRVRLVARGVRKRKGWVIEQFRQYRLSWRGRSELKNLTSIESIHSFWPQGDYLYAAMYLNEILARSIQLGDVVENVFEAYETALVDLDGENPIEPALRTFERKLLRELGYEIIFDYELTDGAAVEPDRQYRFVQGSGFMRTNDDAPDVHWGRSLLAIAQNDYYDKRARRTAKIVLREALQRHIGLQPLESRQLFLAKSLQNVPINRNSS